MLKGGAVFMRSKRKVKQNVPAAGNRERENAEVRNFEFSRYSFEDPFDGLDYRYNYKVTGRLTESQYRHLRSMENGDEIETYLRKNDISYECLGWSEI